LDDPAGDGSAKFWLVDLIVDAEPSLGGAIALRENRETNGLVDFVGRLDGAVDSQAWESSRGKDRPHKRAL
jgi:hypothetical protein